MLTVNRQELTAALRRAAKIAPKTSSIAALRTVKLAADAESLMLSATNLEQAQVEILPAMGNGKAKPATLCVPLTPLLGVINALPQYLRDVSIEVRPDHVLVGTAKLAAGCPLTDFPVIPRTPDDARAIIELPDDFMRQARFVRAAVGQEATRYALTGILFDFAHGNIVASDGKRLHCAHIWEPCKLKSVIVPPDAFDIDVPTHLTLPKPDASGEVHEVFFFTSTGYIVSKTTDGNYPDYLPLVRKEHTLTVSVDRAELASALEQALPMVHERTPSCLLHVNERFEIHAENSDTGAAYVNEVAAAADGPELKVTVNPHLLLGLLRTMTAQDVTLAFRKPDEAIYVVADNGAQWALVMPLNLATSNPAPTKASAKR